MKASISKSEVRGIASAPPSKSYTIRGVMCTALAKGESEIIYPLISDDTQAAINVLRQVGIRIHDKGDRWQVIGGNFHKPATQLFCVRGKDISPVLGCTEIPRSEVEINGK